MLWLLDDDAVASNEVIKRHSNNEWHGNVRADIIHESLLPSPLRGLRLLSAIVYLTDMTKESSDGGCGSGE